MAFAQPHDKVRAGPKKLRILIADDNRDSADSLAALLRQFGHEVAVTHSGTDALRIATTQQPDVVVLDIGLPGMDGYHVAQGLRGQQKLTDIRLIALTGYGQKEDIERSHRAGFNDHLVKPIRFPDLLKLLWTSP